MITINLLPRPRVSFFRPWLLAAALLALLLAAALWFVKLELLDEDLSRLRLTLSGQRAAVAAGQARLRAARQASEAAEDYWLRLAFLADQEERRRDLPRFLAALEALRPHKRLWLDRLNLNSGRLLLEGRALEPAALEEFLTALSASGLIDPASLDFSRSQPAEERPHLAFALAAAVSRPQPLLAQEGLAAFALPPLADFERNLVALRAVEAAEAPLSPEAQP